MADFLHRYVFKNAGFKILSLLLAIGLWVAVARSPLAEVAITVPIELHNFPENLEIANEHIPEAQIRVRGPERFIRELRANELHVELDLAGSTMGERTFDLTAQQVRQPRELEVVQVIPTQVRLMFDQRLVRAVEVRPRVIGNFASGMRVARVEADPSMITISGPKQRVEKVDAAITDPVDATGVMKQSSFTTHAYVSDPLVQVLQPGPIRVTVKMEEALPYEEKH
jgi:YbbR domain-containing protein